MLATEAVHVSEAEFRRISKMVYDHCGINLHDGKRELVQARIAKRMRGGTFRSVSDYLDHVVADATGNEFTQLIDAISTNLTSFFREDRHFAFLRETFLPALAARKAKANDRRIVAWSAGCSTGEEPYSLAITLLEQFDPSQWDVKLLATDISTRVLRHATAGLYAKDKVANVPPQPRAKYFTQVKGPGGEASYQASPQLKNVIRFRHLNLIPTWPFSGPFDFIFCRNVMIYFDKPTQETLIGRFYDVLDRGGMLFTGHSESLTGIKHKFHYVQPTIYGKT